MRRVKLETIGVNQVLTCPDCGTHCLHQETVDVYEREEDADSGIHVMVTDGQVEKSKSQDGNPSSRRNGLTMRFWCEKCANFDRVLAISQHKGLTYVEWIKS